MNEEMEVLFKAALYNDVQVVQELLRKSIDLNYVNSRGDNVLNIAVANNREEMVRFLVLHGAILNNKRTNISPIILAIKFDHQEMVGVLIDLGANVEEGWFNNQQITPLLFAVSLLNYKVIKLLIQKGANVNHVDPATKTTALHEVGGLNLDHRAPNTVVRLRIAKLLLRNRANLAAEDQFNSTPLGRAISHSVELSKLFIKEGAAVRRQADPNGQSFFDYVMCAVGLNNPELVRLCLERGGDYANQGFINGDFTTPYHRALKETSHEVIKVFWEFGCQVDLVPAMPGPLGLIPMEWCDLQVRNDNVGIVQAQFSLIKGIKLNDLNMVLSAIEKGAEPKGTAREMPSTLHHLAATSKGNYKIARVLLENGVPVNKLDDSVKKTCLFFSFLNNNLNITKELFKFGACFTNQDLDTLRSVKDKEIHKIMEEITKAFNFTRKGSPKVLKQVKKYIKVGDKDMAKVIMNCVDWRGRSLLGLALNKGHVKLAENLMMLRLEHL